MCFKGIKDSQQNYKKHVENGRHELTFLNFRQVQKQWFLGTDVGPIFTHF